MALIDGDTKVMARSQEMWARLMRACVDLYRDLLRLEVRGSGECVPVSMFLCVRV